MFQDNENYNFCTYILNNMYIMLKRLNENYFLSEKLCSNVYEQIGLSHATLFFIISQETSVIILICSPVADIPFHLDLRRKMRTVFKGMWKPISVPLYKRRMHG